MSDPAATPDPMNTTQARLNQLITLKKRATTLPGYQHYRETLTRATRTWTQGAGDQHHAMLCYDGLIDALAHDTGTQP